jgi:hypothetical protein
MVNIVLSNKKPESESLLCAGLVTRSIAVRQHCKDKGTVKRRIPTKQGEQEMLLKNIVHLKLLEWSNKGDG